MSSEEFRRLVAKVERRWSSGVAGARCHAAGWAMAGVVLLLAPFFLGLGVAGGAALLAHRSPGPWTPWMTGIGIAAAAGLLVLMVAVLRGRPAPTDGEPLDGERAPGLHDEIERLGARFDEVRVVPGMNASTLCVRSGLRPCGSRRVLRLGLSLMDVLPPEEFRAVLAHEACHAVDRHGMAGCWVEWLRLRWQALLSLPGPGAAKWFATRVFGWFWPRFNARALALARLSELEADRAAARQVEGRVLASALCRLAIEAERERRFVELHESRHGKASGDFQEQLRVRLAQAWNDDRSRRSLAKALEREPEGAEAHPSLARRLEALGFDRRGEDPELPLPAGERASDRYLDPAYAADLRARFSAARRERSGRRHDREAGAGGPSVGDAWERIAALTRLDGLSRMQPEIVSLLERAPEHAGASFLRGSHLAAAGDEAAVVHLERAAGDPTMAGQALRVLEEFHRRRGESELADGSRLRADRHDRELKEALRERAQVRAGDRFGPVGLGDESIRPLRRALAAEAVVRRAWLVARDVEHFPRWPHLVLLLEVERPPETYGAWRGADDLPERVLCRAALPGYVHVEVLGTANRRLGRAIRRAAREGPVFRRKALRLFGR